MLIKEAIEMLRDSVLRHVKVGEDDNAVIGFINLGILELHKRFRMSFDEAVITPVIGKRVYTLDGADPDVSIDLARKELLVIETIVDSDYEEVPLNVLIDPKSAKTLSFNTIRLAEEADSTSYTVTFRTAPEFSVLRDYALPISSAFIEPLFHYVGYQAFLSVQGEENTQHSLHKKRFEESLQRVAALGLYQQSDMRTDRLEERTFT